MVTFYSDSGAMLFTKIAFADHLTAAVALTALLTAGMILKKDILVLTVLNFLISFYKFNYNLALGIWDVIFDIYESLRYEVAIFSKYLREEGFAAPIYYLLSLTTRLATGLAFVIEYLFNNPVKVLSRLWDYFNTPSEPGRGEGRMIAEAGILFLPLNKLKISKPSFLGKIPLESDRQMLRKIAKWAVEKPGQVIDILRSSRNVEDEK